MTERKLEEIKNIIKPILIKYDVIKASIFGSYARGETTKNSDIDILIEIEGEKSLLDLVALKSELEELLGIKVDLVEFNTIHPELKQTILTEQVPIL